MVDLENASAFDVIPISQAMDPVPFIVHPFITVIDRSEFLLLSYTGASTMGLFITSNGDPVRGTLEWGQHPISLSTFRTHVARFISSLRLHRFRLSIYHGSSPQRHY